MLAAIFGLSIAVAPDLDLRWSAPPDCPSEADVRARVADLLAEGGSGRREAVALDMRVTKTEQGFELRATATGGGGQGERVVTGLRCSDVAEAGVLIAAIAIDPDLRPPESESGSESRSESESESGSDSDSDSDADSVPAPASAPTPAPASAPAPAPASAPARARAPAPRLTPLLDAGLGIAFGRLAAPLPMPYARFGAGFERSRFRLLGRLSGFGPSFGEAERGSARGIFGLGTIGIAPCVQSLGSPWRIVGCLATDVGLVGGRGRNTINPSTQYSVFWAIEAEVGVEYAVRPTVALALRADGAGVPASPNLVIDTQGQVCCVEWGAGLRLGVVGRFGTGAERVR